MSHLDIGRCFVLCGVFDLIEGFCFVSARTGSFPAYLDVFVLSFTAPVPEVTLPMSPGRERSPQENPEPPAANYDSFGGFETWGGGIETVR